MTDGTAGWFRDPNDPALARWHDGDRWTEHTLVIADQTPGSEPPPPVITPTPEPTSAFDSGGFGSSWESSYTEPVATPSRGGLPSWAKIVAPLAVIAVAAAAFLILSGGDDDPSTDQTETADSSPGTIDEAVDAARRAGLPDEVSDQRAAALIEQICDAANDPSDVDDLGQQLGSLPASSATDLRQTVAALGIGASRRCEDDLDDEPDLINDLQDAAVVAFTTSTTVPTILGEGEGDGGVDAGTDGGGTTGDGGGTTRTTRRSGGSSGTTVTTARPTTTTTLPQVMAGQPCSNEGAQAQDKVSGSTVTCTRSSVTNCSGPRTWRKGGACQATTTTAPSTGSSVPLPTVTTAPGNCVPPNCDGS